MLPINLEVRTFDYGLEDYWDSPSHYFVSIDFIGKFSEEVNNFIVIEPKSPLRENKDVNSLFLPISFDDAKEMAKNIISIIDMIENNQKIIK
jgi:hypothetical protein